MLDINSVISLKKIIRINIIIYSIILMSLIFCGFIFRYSYEIHYSEIRFNDNRIYINCLSNDAMKVDVKEALTIEIDSPKLYLKFKIISIDKSLNKTTTSIIGDFSDNILNYQRISQLLKKRSYHLYGKSERLFNMLFLKK